MDTSMDKTGPMAKFNKMPPLLKLYYEKNNQIAVSSKIENEFFASNVVLQGLQLLASGDGTCYPHTDIDTLASVIEIRLRDSVNVHVPPNSQFFAVEWAKLENENIRIAEVRNKERQRLQHEEQEFLQELKKVATPGKEVKGTEHLPIDKIFVPFAAANKKAAVLRKLLRSAQVEKKKVQAENKSGVMNLFNSGPAEVRFSRLFLFLSFLVYFSSFLSCRPRSMS
jgi:hypothetical protein